MRPSQFLVGILVLLSLACLGQTPPESQVEPAPQDHPYTLHVYTDLVQVPALVLDRHGAPAVNLTPQSFQLQLDSGPLFHPAAVHLEGDEPLSLAIVLDASGAEKELAAALSSIPGHGVPHAVLPHDHVSVYAFDCKIVRSVHDAPALDTYAQTGVTQALESPSLHKPNAPTKTCHDSKHLWDALALAAIDLGGEPGRRAILVITDGEDDGSKTNWQDLKTFAMGKSVAIFALREAPDISDVNTYGVHSMSSSSDSATSNITKSGIVTSGFSSVTSAPGEDKFQELVQRTGGVVLSGDRGQLEQQLDRFVALLHSRYILQFPRPADTAGGAHRLDVRVPVHDAIVRTAGVAVPLRNAVTMNDPNTVPSDTSKLPVFGKRKPLN